MVVVAMGLISPRLSADAAKSTLATPAISSPAYWQALPLARRIEGRATILGVAVNNADEQFEQVISGSVRPPQIPSNWIGEPVSPGKMWRWHDPDNPGNSVTFCRGDPLGTVVSERQHYVLVYRDGVSIGQDGQPITQ